nr:MAG TPA: hypothetical protein [Caudoviricetes sp.]
MVDLRPKNRKIPPLYLHIPRVKREASVSAGGFLFCWC